MKIDLVSGQVRSDGRPDGIPMHIWTFAAYRATDPEWTEDWANVRTHTAEVPDGTTFVTNLDDPDFIALYPDGSLHIAPEFAAQCAARERWEQARDEADERIMLARKHRQDNYWMAAEVACNDSADLSNLYASTLTPELRQTHYVARANELLRFLAHA